MIFIFRYLKIKMGMLFCFLVLEELLCIDIFGWLEMCDSRGFFGKDFSVKMLIMFNMC